MRIVAARLPNELGGGGPVLEIDVLELRARQVFQHLIGALGIVEEVADALLVVAQK